MAELIKTNTKGQILCPICRRATATRVNPDTVLIRFPLYCSWCKREIIIDK
ncbi:MAG: conjugal transfer protein [Oscillospiraceae bacterium]|nr:conjugal transfer protein [Oscillospiraceae bacterium]